MQQRRQDLTSAFGYFHQRLKSFQTFFFSQPDPDTPLPFKAFAFLLYGNSSENLISVGSLDPGGRITRSSNCPTVHEICWMYCWYISLNFCWWYICCSAAFSEVKLKTRKWWGLINIFWANEGFTVTVEKAQDQEKPNKLKDTRMIIPLWLGQVWSCFTPFKAEIRSLIGIFHIRSSHLLPEIIELLTQSISIMTKQSFPHSDWTPSVWYWIYSLWASFWI